MTKPKVLHIVTHIVGGGAEKNTIDTVKGLHRLGYEVHLMSGGNIDHNLLGELELPSDVQTIIIPELTRNINPVKDYVAYRRICRQITKEKYKIVHTHMAKAGVLGRSAARKSGVPCVIYGIHGMLFPRTANILKRWTCRMIERYCGRYTDHFVAVGEDLKRQYISAGVGEPSKYHVIHTGIDVERFRKASNNSQEEICKLKKDIGVGIDDVVVGMVTRFDKNKGIEYFIEAAANVGRKIDHVKFVVVGDGKWREELNGYAAELGVLDKVIFTGYRSDIADMISIFDVAVLTSMREGLSQFLVQAALMAKPIVTFAVEGAWEVVKDGVNGYIVPVKSVNTLSDRICKLVNDEGLRSEMGERSRHVIGNSRTVDNMINQIDELYRKCFN